MKLHDFYCFGLVLPGHKQVMRVEVYFNITPTHSQTKLLKFNQNSNCTSSLEHSIIYRVVQQIEVSS